MRRGPVEVATAAPDREQVEAGVVADLRAGHDRAVERAAGARSGTARTRRRSRRARPRAPGASPRPASTSHTSCCAASPTSSDAAPRCSSPRSPDGSTVSAAGAQHPELELLAHLVEPVLELASPARRGPDRRSSSARVREADRGLRHVLHLDQHVDRAVEVGDRGVLLDAGRRATPARPRARAPRRCPRARRAGSARRRGAAARRRRDR